MIHFPATQISRSIEETVLECLQDFVPKNDSKGVVKVVELINDARAELIKKGDLEDLGKDYQKVTPVENGENPDWLGFSYYYKQEEKLFVGLFQMDKRWWQK